MRGDSTHEIMLDIQSVQTIKTLIGSDQTSFTNPLIENSTAKVVINFGALSKENFIETNP